jgi:hypothetical protein
MSNYGRHEPSVSTLDIGKGETIVYDRQNSEAWIQSDFVVEVGE